MQPAPPILAPDAPQCPECDYDLRGLAGGVCPECGTDVAAIASGASALPWPRRREVGRLRAFARQAWMSLADVRRIAGERGRPVGDADARSFRLTCAAILAIVLWMLTIVWNDAFAASTAQRHDLAGAVLGPAAGMRSSGLPAWAVLDVWLPWSAGAMLGWPLPVGAALLALGLTGVHVYVFAPRGQSAVRRQRAVALADYLAAGPMIAGLLLAAFPIAVWLDPIVVRLRPRTGAVDLLGIGVFLLFLLGGIGSPIAMLVHWLNVVRLHRAVLRGGALATLAVAALVPVLWTASAIACLVVWPWLVGLVWIWIDSFRA